MIRIAALLPAFALAIVLASTGAAFAADGSQAGYDRAVPNSYDQIALARPSIAAGSSPAGSNMTVSSPTNDNSGAISCPNENYSYYTTEGSYYCQTQP